MRGRGSRVRTRSKYTRLDAEGMERERARVTSSNVLDACSVARRGGRRITRVDEEALGKSEGAGHEFERVLTILDNTQKAWEEKGRGSRA